ncbi:unnamed protein product [Ranitomeya imitator]|uniref:Ig-like domain-containing protein n=1 Tax=Ranitomeya imitator TaxID=111125 RepID=A0ABN9L613_9NEOB|nr:unnamed protein product [Ranitomeya imitator]
MKDLHKPHTPKIWGQFSKMFGTISCQVPSKPVYLEEGVTSKQENIKTFSITNSINFPVERRDNGEIVTCEASHPALKGQKKQTQYVLDVQFSPTARIQASQSLVREGDPLTLKCDVTGNPR